MAKKSQADSTQLPPPHKSNVTAGRYQPNITPLIDVLFLLLLFFLLATKPRQDEGQLPTSLPELGGPAAGQVGPKNSVRVLVIPDRTDSTLLNASYSIEGLPAVATGEELRSMLDQMDKEASVEICPSSGCRWGFVVEAFNQAYASGFKEIAFTRPNANPQ